MVKKLNELQITEEIKRILESQKTPYEKKIALFNLVVKKAEVGKMSPEKERRVNHLLESCLFNQLAKQSMKEYKKTTVEVFRKN